MYKNTEQIYSLHNYNVAVYEETVLKRCVNL